MALTSIRLAATIALATLLAPAPALASSTSAVSKPGPDQKSEFNSRTVEGVVDGQKYGTNLISPAGSIVFRGDSKEEEKLLDSCLPGDACKVVVITAAGGVVKNLVSAKRVSPAPAALSGSPK